MVGLVQVGGVSELVSRSAGSLVPSVYEVPTASVSKRFLSLKERMLIFGWRVEGFSIRDIARRLGRSPSTVSRGAEAQWDYLHVLQPLHCSHAGRQATHTS